MRACGAIVMALAVVASQGQQQSDYTLALGPSNPSSISVTGASKIGAMTSDGEFVYGLTDTSVIKANMQDLTNFGVDNLTDNPDGPWDSLTTIVADDDALYVTGRYKGADVDAVSGASLTGRYQLIKFDKSTMDRIASVTLPQQDNIPYAMEQDATHIYLGMYSYPGRVVRIEKGSNLMIVQTLTLPEGADDVRALEIDRTSSPARLYANCNTMPGKVVAIDITDSTSSGMSVDLRGGVMTMPAGVGHILAGDTAPFSASWGSTGSEGGASAVGQFKPDQHVYLATNQNPARVVRLKPDDSTAFGWKFDATLELDAGENQAASLREDATFLYVGLWTTPGKIVRVRKDTMTRDSAVALPNGHDRVAAMNLAETQCADPNLGNCTYLLAGTYSDPATISELHGLAAPRDCHVQTWGEWTQCSQTCGHGFTERRRVITDHPMYGGAACPATHEQKDCFQAMCPKVCPHGQVMTANAYVTPRTCDNRRSWTATNSSTAGCQCPPEKPFLHEVANGVSMCVSEGRCDKYHLCPASSTTCQYQQLPSGGGRIRVLHGKCHSMPDHGTGSCEAHQDTNLGAPGYQYHCRHTTGRMGGCECLCYTPSEFHCGYPGDIANGGVTVQGNHIGGEATYACQSGFTLHGAQTRHCMSNTKWSGTVPQCL